jgi:hypothetical protein
MKYKMKSQSAMRGTRAGSKYNTLAQSQLNLHIGRTAIVKTNVQSIVYTRCQSDE